MVFETFINVKVEMVFGRTVMNPISIPKRGIEDLIHSRYLSSELHLN